MIDRHPPSFHIDIIIPLSEIKMVHHIHQRWIQSRRPDNQLVRSGPTILQVYLKANLRNLSLTQREVFIQELRPTIKTPTQSALDKNRLSAIGSTKDN